MIDLISVGRVGGKHGVDGSLRLLIDEGVQILPDIQFLFIDREGSKVPYGIEIGKLAKDEIIKLEEFNSPEALDAVMGHEVFIERGFYKSHEYVDQEVYGYLVGYSCLDLDGREIGEVKSILVLPQQEVAEVSHGEENFLLPLNDSLIKEIDVEEKKVMIEIPEGLIDLNASP